MSDDINDGGPAFPRNYNASGHNGMSLRDWFAGHALAALISKAPFFDRDGEHGEPMDIGQFNADMAVSAYSYADAMLAARKGGAA